MLLGRLRFKAPADTEKWDGIVDAKVQPKACMQSTKLGNPQWKVNRRVSEDCLYLNVHVPKPTHISDTKVIYVLFELVANFTGFTYCLAFTSNASTKVAVDSANGITSLPPQ